MASKDQKHGMAFSHPSLHIINEKPDRKQGFVSSLLRGGKVSWVASPGSSIDHTRTSIFVGLGEETQGYDRVDEPKTVENSGDSVNDGQLERLELNERLVACREEFLTFELL
ncbi:hypothetical protein NE237_021506 [Protea cynaroides]|uniref:Uncharacterized protein n=1 Tax=Protea cynaroides TaxID=273540 RepID=A0A9Q0H7Y2_9MAGN|nr:hypothetical protein NE237_021506 [Protea cynaroides]